MVKIYDTYGNLLPITTSKDTSNTYDRATDALEAIRDRIDTINTADQIDLDQLLVYCDILDHATHGLANIYGNIASILVDYLSHQTWGLAAIRTGVAGVKADTYNIHNNVLSAITDYLGHGTWGLSHIRAALQLVQTDADQIDANVLSIIQDHLSQMKSNLVRWGQIDSVDGNSFISADLAGLGIDAMPGWWVYVMQADNAAPEGEYRLLTDYANDGDCDHEGFSVALEVGDRVQLLHPTIGMLGEVGTAAAEGAVTSTDFLMAYIKQIVNNTYKLAEVADGTGVYPASVAQDSLIAKILGKDDPAVATSYSNKTDSLEAISDEIHRLHQHVFILFIIPEAVASINADNAVLLVELQKLAHVHTITQADALDFPAFGMYGLAVCGSDIGAASWTTTNLAGLKSFLGLPIVCVDKTAAAYFEIGTDGGDAATKTVIRAISEIEGTVMGIGETSHETVTGLAAGNNTVSSSATYHTLTMVDADITEKVFATETEDPDDTSANTDVVMGLIPRVLDDGSIGVDEEGVDVPASLGFLGFCYDASTLTTLGKGAFYLFCHMMIMTKVLAVAGEATAVAADIRNRLFGNMKNSFTPPAPLVEYIAGQNSVGTKLPVGKSLYDLLGDPTGETLATLTAKWGDIARTLDLILGSRWDSSSDLGTDIGQLLTYTDLIDDGTVGLTNLKALIDAIATLIGTPADTDVSTDIVNVKTVVDALDTLTKAAGDGDLAAMKAAIDALENLSAANVATELETYDGVKRSEATSDKDAIIAAIPAMVGTDNAATEAKQDVSDANIVDIEALVDSKIMGRLQVATTTWDLLRGGAGAGTDVLFTGTAQAVILESLIARMPTTADVTDGDPITSMAVATDDAEPGIIIAATDAPVASMTPESQFGWTGTLYIPVDTEIEGTIAGGDADAECLVIVTATYRAVVSGGYLA